MTFAQEIHAQVLALLKAETATTPDRARPFDIWLALSRVIVGLLADRWEATRVRYGAGRQTHYFSAEFLEGRSLINNLINLDLYDEVAEAVRGLGLDLDRLETEEADPALGNGGLGRLAACFLDSSATRNLPVTGYGILYRYGLFRQEIENGFQKEYPDAWMERPYPFMIRRDAEKVRVHFQDLDVFAVPYDMPITGYHTDNVNTLRLWRAEPAEEFDFNLFNAQRFDDAVIRRNRVNDIYRVLYPNDSSYDGKVLRVRQQYFFVSASLQRIVSAFLAVPGRRLVDFAQYNAIQLNDTHPVIAIPELMRILTAEHGLTWEQAWPIVRLTFAYTNHTIMAEALEKWDISIFQFLLPDILAIIERIDSQFREEVRSSGLSGEQIQNLAPLGDGKVRMAWLAIYSSHSVNGVAAMHSRILQQNTLRDFYQLWPERFNNKTNGVTPRRWLRQCNPDLAALLSELSGGDAWLTDLGQLAKLCDLQDDETVLRRLIAVKRGNKERLARYLLEKEHIKVDSAAIFDIQIKRLHEYKRQLLNGLLILDQYFQIRDNPGQTHWPCVYFFGAKAAPGYFRAKAIIKLINEIARLVNRDPVASRIIQVHFLPNYNVSLAQLLFPAADVSEQISTVGMEASGTGNMKFMMNGAVTLGTCDGANVEIAEAVGPENIYQFGCRVEDFDKTWSYYNPRWQYDNIPGLRRCIDALVDGTLSDSGSGMFHDLYNSLLHGSNWQPADPYYVLGDFDEYRLVRRQLQQDYQDDLAWARKCWINITSSGRFSSDRTIAEYAAGIWRLQPLPLAE